MNRIAIYFILTLGLFSCRYIGPADGIFTKNIEIKPEIKALEGVWEVDQQSYDLVREQYSLNGKKIKLFSSISIPIAALTMATCGRFWACRSSAALR